MRTSLKRLALLTFVIAIASVTACKPKKMITQAVPVPIAAEPVREPTKPMPAAEQDSDGDGIVDSKDNCPNKVGTAENNGCPEAAVAVPTFNYKNILFEFNSAVLKTSSYLTLDDIAKEMRKYPDMMFTLNGHSSSEGTEARNMTLSVDRATAVKSYLVSAGISSRNLESKGFGESMPLNTVNTEAARQQNRRVEIKKEN